MYKHLFLFFVFSGFFSSLFAVHIEGRVIDEISQEPLEHARVIVVGTPYGDLTDSDGYFSIPLSENGDYELEIHYLGYESQKKLVQFPLSEEGPIICSLKPGAIDISTVTITGNTDPSASFRQLNALDLKVRSLPSSQQALQLVPGLFLAQHAGGGKAEQIFLRGFDLDHGTDIQLSVDGLPVNMVSHAHGQGYSDLHFIIPELIQNIDFTKGPYEGANGNFSTTGAVAFQTYDKLPENLIRLEAGQFGYLRGMGMAGTNFGKRSYGMIAAEFTRSDGYFEAAQDFNRLNLFGKYQIKVGEHDKIQLNFSSFSSEWLASGQIPVRAIESGLISRWGAIDSTEGGITNRRQAILRHEHKGHEGNFEQQLFAIYYDFELYSNFTFFLEDPENGDQIRQREQRMIYGYQNRYRRLFSIGKSVLRSEVGLQVRLDESQDNELSHTFRREQVLNRLALGSVQESNFSAYTEQAIVFNDQWTLQFHLRFDQFFFAYQDQLEDPLGEVQKNQKAFVSPKLQVHFTPKANHQWYLKLGRGFHSNDTRLVLADPVNPMLAAGYGADFGWLGKPAERIWLNVALWSLYLEQELVYVGDAGIVEPSDHSFRIGLEASMRYQITDILFADVDLSYTRARSLGVPEGENLIPLAPLFTCTGGLSFRGHDHWSGSIRYRWLADRPANPDNSLVAEGYFLLEAKVAYRWKMLEWSINAFNLLNTDWREAQFETESLLKGELMPVNEIHFTPGSPLNINGAISLYL